MLELMEVNICPPPCPVSHWRSEWGLCWGTNPPAGINRGNDSSQQHLTRDKVCFFPADLNHSLTRSSSPTCYWWHQVSASFSHANSKGNQTLCFIQFIDEANAWAAESDVRQQINVFLQVLFCHQHSSVIAQSENSPPCQQHQIIEL